MSWKLTKFQLILIQHIQTIVIFIFFYLLIFWLSGNFFKFHANLFQTDAESFSFLSGETSFISNKFFWPFCQYQNKKALFTDSIFTEGFGFRGNHLMKIVVQCTMPKWSLKLTDLFCHCGCCHDIPILLLRKQYSGF